MTQLSGSEIAERKRMVRQALKEWDPIGVAHIPEADDEYDGYVPTLYNIVISKKGRDEIIDYLSWLETEQIGMPGDRDGIERFADRLLNLRFQFPDVA